nr:MAG TPA: hypothetical protein [Caudoviricetes sp.]
MGDRWRKSLRQHERRNCLAKSRRLMLKKLFFASTN